MPLDRNELERLADDVYRDRRITRSLYCDQCGYNLRTLPRKYVCPECGNEYNARPPLMTGIFFPHDTQLPLAEVAWTLGSGTVAALLIWGAVNPVRQNRLIVGVVCALLALGFAIRGCLRLRRFVKFRTIAKRIAVHEEE